MGAFTAAYTPTASSDAAALDAFGGLLGGHVLTDRRFRQQQQTQALNSVAYGGGASRHPVTPHPCVPSSSTPEQKLDQLDKLASGGYITPAEYQAGRTAILDSM